MEIASGVALGVLIGDGLVRLIGVGGWQISIGVGLAMTTAVFLGGSGLVMNQAASSAVLITAVPLAHGVAFYSRFIDAMVGGAVGVITSLAVPLRPFALVQRASTPVLEAVIRELRKLSQSFRTASPVDASSALEGLRATEPLLRMMESAVAAGVETARLAPARRGARVPIARISQVAVHLDRAVRNLRVLARRGVRLIAEEPHAAARLAPALDALTEAMSSIRSALQDIALLDEAREHALEAVRLAEAVRSESNDLSFSVVVAQVRSVAVDVLRASGMDEDAAIALIRSG